MRKRFHSGDIVKHFKREKAVLNPDSDMYSYVYKILVYAQHTETKEELVIYQALYGNQSIYARPVAMFESEVDKEKYPTVKQRYRFELMSDNELEELNNKKQFWT